MKQLRYILLPFSGFYWLFTYIRNLCFDKNILPQTEFSLPLISVGNITVGGTGKTPHVQYLVNLLRNKNVATLSRGYKRKSEGFVLANAETSVSTLGDEPFLLQQRFPDLHVAVCEKRVEGVSKLLETVSDLDAIILDDAYQHRYVKPGLQLLLVDYNRPLWNDWVFPAGMLREGTYAVSRAHIVVVSKCPQSMAETETKLWRQKLRLRDNQQLFFSAMQYDAIYQYSTKLEVEAQQFLTSRPVSVVTGIAQPKPMIDYVQSFGGRCIAKTYPDHYAYSEEDAKELVELAQNYTLLTTEKDVYKLSECVDPALLYVLPIMPRFLFGAQPDFDSAILSFVG